MNCDELPLYLMPSTAPVSLFSSSFYLDLVENFTSPLEWRRPWAKEKKREVKSEKNPIGEVDLEFYPSI